MSNGDGVHSDSTGNEGLPPDNFEQGCFTVADGEKTGEVVCGCLADSLEKIAKAQTTLAFVANEWLNRQCDSVDDCADKILAKIRERIEGPIYATQECQRMVSAGLQGTLEYAVRCASNVAERCDAICSAGDSSTEGQCCKTCGQANCVCKQGDCVPAETQPPEQTEPAAFVGYCSPLSNVVVVLANGVSPPPGYSAVSYGSTEAEAKALADIACQRIIKPGVSPKFTIKPANTGFACDLPPLAFGKSSSPNINVGADMLDAYARGLIESFSNPVLSFLGVDANITTIADITFKSIISKVIELAGSTGLPFAELIGCKSQNWLGAFSVLSIAGPLSQYLGIPLNDVVLPYRYVANYECPQRHLTETQAATAFLAGELSEDDLRKLWRMNGFCETNLADYVNAVRTKPNALQLAVMRHRELITAAEYGNKIRELGYLGSDDSENLFQITRQVPVLSDIIRFMVRDADDINLVNRFGLDTDFGNKYGRQLQRWAKDQGIDDDYARYAWRSHWQIPSPQQLFEFYHRLRNNPKFGGPNVLLDNVKAALIQQDILPFWHDYYLATSFRPMRLRDLRRSFQVGSLDESELFNGYLQLGYSDDTAKKMLDYTSRERDNALINSLPIKQWTRFLRDRPRVTGELQADGFPDAAIERAFRRAAPAIASSYQAKAFIKGLLTKQQFIDILTNHGVEAADVTALVDALSFRRLKHDAIESYQIGTITRASATQTMVNAGMSQQVVVAILDSIDNGLDNDRARNCQRAIKRKFVMGEIDNEKAIRELVSAGTVRQRAAFLVDAWECELKSGRREVSASKLCEWLGRGVLQPVQFIERLVRIGYSRGDSELMLADCLTAENEKRAREAAKAAKEQATASQRLRKKADMTKAAIEREQAKMRRLSESKARLKLSREKALYTIIGKLVGKVQNDLPEIGHFVSGEVKRLDRQFAVTEDQALQILVLAANEFERGTLSEFAAVADEIAETTVKAELSDEPKQVALPGRNGTA